jgi:hypothetical protein
VTRRCASLAFCLCTRFCDALAARRRRDICSDRADEGSRCCEADAVAASHVDSVRSKIGHTKSGLSTSSRAESCRVQHKISDVGSAKLAKLESQARAGNHLQVYLLVLRDWRARTTRSSAKKVAQQLAPRHSRPARRLSPHANAVTDHQRRPAGDERQDDPIVASSFSTRRAGAQLTQQL